MKNTPDEKDLELLKARIAQRDRRNGPRIGDFVRLLDDTERRLTHDWGDDIQTTVGNAHPCFGDVSFYLGKNGGADFSGSLDKAIPKSQLIDTGEIKSGGFWFFHHDYMTAHNGVSVTAPCRIFKQKEVAA